MTYDQATDVPFRELVRKADGVQPWRKIFHAANGMMIVLALQTIPVGHWTALGLMGAAFVLMALVDWVRLANPQLNHLFFRTFLSLVSPREARKVASSTWYALGVILALLPFAPWWAALAAAAVAALVERTPWPVDDNLVIPVTVAAVLHLAAL